MDNSKAFNERVIKAASLGANSKCVDCGQK